MMVDRTRPSVRNVVPTDPFGAIPGPIITHVSDSSPHMRTIPVAAASDRIRNRHRQEVRHDHYAVHRFQHANDDYGPLSAIGRVRQCAGLPQHDIHLYL